MLNFDGKTVAITGGASGIGLETAKAFVEAGARVALLSRGREDLDKAAASLNVAKDRVLTFDVDVRKPDQVHNAFDAIGKEWSGLDVLFLNAGINGVWAPIEDISPDEWDATVETNLKGSYLCFRAGLPLLRKQRGSVIINSSVNGTRMFSNGGATCYACTKAALVAFSRMQALEQAEHGVRVNTVCPGFIDTGIQEKTQERDVEEATVPVQFPEGNVPLTGGAPGTPRQVADVVLFLASPLASHVTGAAIFVDGAQSLLQG